MRYAIVADIHSSLAAFTAVLDDIEVARGNISCDRKFVLSVN